MKRKMKKAASLVLSLVMVMGMAGCSMEKEAKEPEKETATKAAGTPAVQESSQALYGLCHLPYRKKRSPDQTIPDQRR